MHRETRISNYLLAAFSAISFIFMALPLSGPVQALKAGMAYAFVPAAFYGSEGAERLARVPSNIRGLLSAEMRNQALLEDMRRWALMRAETESLRRENERLQRALGLRPLPGRSPIWARVIERDPLHWYRSFMVDAGSVQGVTLNAPVLGQSGENLVALGRVTEVGERHSKILLLTDGLSSAAAYVSTAAVEGLLQGQGNSRLIMNYISAEAVLAEGSPVFTSRTSATFPPDILIGEIDQIRPRDPFLMSLSVSVKPAADASSFSEVMILVPGPRSAP